MTIIPANLSCRGSGTLDPPNDAEDDSFVDDVILDFDQHSVESTTEDEALCENLSIHDSEDDDATSASTGTQKSANIVGDNGVRSGQATSKIDKAADTELLAPRDTDHDADSADSCGSLRNASKCSTPSPPANLHRYFHLFRCGELEELIEQNIENLYVVKSYYSEHATSWCVVAEKVQVWTI